MDTLTVRLKALDGQWEECGKDRLRGVTPKNLQLSANNWGSDKASFDLHRDPSGVWPDLTAFTDVDVLVNGVPVWSGRVAETPARDGDDRVINVHCDGWQYHLDDDVYQRAYVHTRISDYVDMRSLPNATLGSTALAAGPQLTTEGGQIVFTFPAGFTTATGDHVGVSLDLGQDSLGKRIVVTWTGSATDANVTLYARASDYPDNSAWATAGTYSDFFSATQATGPTTSAGTAATARRYVQLFFYRNGGAGTYGADSTVRISSVQVFADTSYESSNTSALKASTVVADALSRGTILLSSSTTGISTTSFNIPSLALDGYKTPRQVIDGVNSYHDYLAQVDVDRKMVFTSKPTAPVLEVGNQSSVEFEDASMNDGSEVYNRVIVQAEGPDGSQLSVSRRHPTSSLDTTTVSSPAADNPSFATNTTSWTATLGTLTRTTTAGEFDSGTSGGKLTIPATGAQVSETFTGTFLAGKTYTLTFKAKLDTGNAVFNAYFGSISNGDYGAFQTLGLTTSFQTVTVSWAPAQTRTSGVTLVLYVNPTLVSPAGIIYIDTLSLSTVLSTVVDRRGFRRTKILPVSSALTADAANQIGDVWLQGHKTTPFRGSLKVTGNGVRRVLGGQPIHPSQLLLYTGQKIRFANRIDPDTGAWGRDGSLASVSYDFDQNAASAEIDSQRGNFDVLLNRLAVIQGG